jgi:hypothetical protein
LRSRLLVGLFDKGNSLSHSYDPVKCSLHLLQERFVSIYQQNHSGDSAAHTRGRAT